MDNSRNPSFAPFTPWQFEPTGPNIRLMTRMSAADYSSWQGFRWPHTGYVEAENWTTRTAEPRGPLQVYRSDHECGLWGFLHGDGNYRMAFTLYEEGVHQIVAVDEAETVNGRGRSCRVPRGWVKFTGDLPGAMKYLRGHDDPYYQRVADNLLASHGDAAFPKVSPLQDVFDLLQIGARK